MSPTARLLGLAALGLASARPIRAQSEALDLMLPGSEYNRTDLPPNPAGTWWVLHGAAGETVLQALPVTVTAVRGCGDDTPENASGRAVSVPAVRDPVFLVRGAPGLRAGPVRTAFLDDGGTGEAERVEVRWGDDSLIVRHIVREPSGDQPGEYRIELTLGDRVFLLHSDEWQGDGHWRVRWIGDLNRDGTPDLLLDASHKYSVYTTRLYLSREVAGHPTIVEAASFTHFAC